MLSSLANRDKFKNTERPPGCRQRFDAFNATGSENDDSYGNEFTHELGLHNIKGAGFGEIRAAIQTATTS